MTNYKPLTDAELDLDADSIRRGVPLSMPRQVRLIAQARRANQLQTELYTVATDAVRIGSALVLLANRDDGDDDLIPRGLVVSLAVKLKDLGRNAEDPADRATRELGEWLVAMTLARRHPLADICTDRDGGTWRCSLWWDDTAGVHESKPTQYEAIFAALKAAKESGR